MQVDTEPTGLRVSPRLRVRGTALSWQRPLADVRHSGSYRHLSARLRVIITDERKAVRRTLVTGKIGSPRDFEMIARRILVESFRAPAAG